MQNIILLAKVESAKRKEVAVDMPAIAVMWAYNTTNVQLKYNQLLNHIDNKIAINLEL